MFIITVSVYNVFYNVWTYHTYNEPDKKSYIIKQCRFPIRKRTATTIYITFNES